MPFVFVGGSAPFLPSSMTKNGAQQISTTTPWWTVPNWTSEVGTYPGSTLVGHGLQVSADKIAAVISAALPFSGGVIGTNQHQARLLVDGLVVGTGLQVSGTAGTLLVSATVDVAAGSIVTVEATTTASAAWAPSITTGAGTFVRIT